MRPSRFHQFFNALAGDPFIMSLDYDCKSEKKARISLKLKRRWNMKRQHFYQVPIKSLLLNEEWNYFKWIAFTHYFFFDSHSVVAERKRKREYPRGATKKIKTNKQAHKIRNNQIYYLLQYFQCGTWCWAAAAVVQHSQYIIIS